MEAGEPIRLGFANAPPWAHPDEDGSPIGFVNVITVDVQERMDPEVIGEVTNVIKRLVDTHNLTMLMVTHQMGFAREISDRVCFFYNGAIEEQGTPAELFENPRRERTRQFLNAVLHAN